MALIQRMNYRGLQTDGEMEQNKENYGKTVKLKISHKQLQKTEEEFQETGGCNHFAEICPEVETSRTNFTAEFFKMNNSLVSLFMYYLFGAMKQNLNTKRKLQNMT